MRAVRTKGIENTSKRITNQQSAVMNMECWHPNYQSARRQLVCFLRTQGFRVHPDEVYCPSIEHCWVDVAALKGLDYWAFEYKSRNDSIKRGLEQCRSYSHSFNYVVLVADRHRATASPYFANFKRNGFGVWSHAENGFNPLLQPRRRTVARHSKHVIERQFIRLRTQLMGDRKISDWFPTNQTNGAT
ncbi:MAG TPA: hypothetical protein VEI80_06145 [Candidatus Acidoferrales bacterium]|nr:hypothetical protein [Candidatus Acidoferrales bacterium]